MSKKKSFLFTILFFVSFSGSCLAGAINQKANMPLQRGVWVTVFSEENVLRSKDNIDRLIGICKKSGINNIYIQIYRADKAYYDSNLTDRTPYEDILSETKEDPLKYLLEKTKIVRIKVHAWMNVFSIAQNKDAEILKKFGNGVLTKDQHDRFTMSLKDEKDYLDKFYIRENQLFLEPADICVKKYLIDIAKEIIKKYPDFAGLHLDYIRYPIAIPFIPGSKFTSHGLSYGYGEDSVKNFEETAGLNVKTMPATRENFNLWDEWRRTQITDFLRELSADIRALSPKIEISCTIVPSLERTYLTSFQNWTTWLNKGYADYVIVMNYTDNTEFMELNSKALLALDADRRIYIGLGAYLVKDNPEIIKNQLSSLQKLSPSGIVIFSYDEIAKNEDLQKFMADYFNQVKN